MIPAVILIAALALLPGAVLEYASANFAPQSNLPELQAQQTHLASTAIPIRSNQSSPQLTASGVYAYDRGSGQVLYGKEGATPRPIASITKLATAITIIHRHQMSDVITIPKLPTYKSEDEVIGLQAGEQYTVGDLMAALLINSANDAADALAISDSGSIQAFSAQMNSLMDEWQIKNAHFSNPSGLTDAGNQVSPQAVAQIAMLALHNNVAKKLVSRQTATITSRGGRTTALKSTNLLLQNNQFSGIKTGYTLAAGECFVGLTTVQGHEIVTVVLGSKDRFGETQSLVNWIKQTYTWQ
jgi:D-alanyl-D-alanine carboxypeptidase (penicillin-binding protein 5/6)